MDDKLKQQVIDRDLTIRYLISKMANIRIQLNHCLDIVDNKPAIYNLIRELERLDKQMAEEYKTLHNTSLSTLSHRIKVEDPNGTQDNTL